jgi:hypothetical protein
MWTVTSITKMRHRPSAAETRRSKDLEAEVEEVEEAG